MFSLSLSRVVDEGVIDKAQEAHYVLQLLQQLQLLMQHRRHIMQEAATTF
jgi:hypothetical protein